MSKIFLFESSSYKSFGPTSRRSPIYLFDVNFKLNWTAKIELRIESSLQKGEDFFVVASLLEAAHVADYFVVVDSFGNDEESKGISDFSLSFVFV